MRMDATTVVAITGASRGIGRSAALEFAKKGAKVVLLSRDISRMEEVAKEVRKLGSAALVLSCDVSKEADCKDWVAKAIDHFGKVDVLINNAAYGYYAPAEHLNTTDLRKIFDTNLFGSIWCAQAVIPHMKKAGRGHIVNVSTIISKRSIPFMTAYCMTKFALNAFDEGLRIELTGTGIGVSLICPGLTATDFQMNAGKSENYKPYASNEGGMTAEKVGVAILKAVEKNKRNVDLTFGGRMLLFVNKISPKLVDQIMLRTLVKRSSENKSL